MTVKLMAKRTSRPSVASVSIKSGTSRPRGVMCCGAAIGRLGFFLDWMEDHKTIEASSRNFATITEYFMQNPIGKRGCKDQSKGVVSLTFERRRTELALHRQIMV